MFDNNFGKYGPIFKILSSSDSWENSLWTHTKTSTSYLICCYTTSSNTKFQKNVTDFYSILGKLLTASWWHFDDLIWHLRVVRETVSRPLTLTDWLTFWSLSDDVSSQHLTVVQLNAVASWWFSSPWLSLHTFRSFYTILHVLYTYLSKIISAIFSWHVT